MDLDGRCLTEACRFPSHQARRGDAVLAEQLRRGDGEAARRFVREYRDDVYTFLRSLTELEPDAEDLTQQTFLRAWREIDAYDYRRGSLRTWLHMIARTEFSHWYRTQRTHARLDEASQLADDRARRSMEAVEVRAALRQLPIEVREVMVLHYLQEYKCREIAEIVARPEGTVKRWLSEGRAHLLSMWVESNPRDCQIVGADRRMQHG